MSNHDILTIDKKNKVKKSYVQALLYKCLIKHAFVQTLCPTISACLFQALWLDKE